MPLGYRVWANGFTAHSQLLLEYSLRVQRAQCALAWQRAGEGDLGSMLASRLGTAVLGPPAGQLMHQLGGKGHGGATKGLGRGCQPCEPAWASSPSPALGGAWISTLSRASLLGRTLQTRGHCRQDGVKGVQCYACQCWSPQILLEGGRGKGGSERLGDASQSHSCSLCPKASSADPVFAKQKAA